MDDKTIARIYSKSPKVIHPVIDVILGIYHRYSPCCVADFTLNTIKEKYLRKERKRRIRIFTLGYRVPCKFHRKKYDMKIINMGFDLDDWYG